MATARKIKTRPAEKKAISQAQSKQAVAIAFKNKVLERSSALGNSKRTLKNIASDLCNAHAAGDKKAIRELAEGTFLCRSTIERIMDCDEAYRPQAESLERVFRYFNAEIVFNEVRITPRWQNKPKEE